MMKNLILVGFFIFCPLLATGQESPALVLFPIPPGMDPGAWGRTWTTSLVVTNRGTETAQMTEYGIAQAGLPVGPGRTLVDPFPTRVYLWRLEGVDEDVLDFRLIARKKTFSRVYGGILPALRIHQRGGYRHPRRSLIPSRLLGGGRTEDV
ncbi:MAG: hypothetical protein ACRD2J_05450, partial [Thermoanaerobaculia bacterium]